MLHAQRSDRRLCASYTASPIHIHPLAGGEEELHALREGRAPPETAYRPRLANIAPRTDGWAPSRSNTQQPPRSGPVSWCGWRCAGGGWAVRVAV